MNAWRRDVEKQTAVVFAEEIPKERKLFVVLARNVPDTLHLRLTPRLLFSETLREWVLGYTVDGQGMGILMRPGELAGELKQKFRISQIPGSGSNVLLYLRALCPLETIRAACFRALQPVVNFGLDKNSLGDFNQVRQYEILTNAIPDPRIAFVLKVSDAPVGLFRQGVMPMMRSSRLAPGSGSPGASVPVGPTRPVVAQFPSEVDEEQTGHSALFTALNLLPVTVDPTHYWPAIFRETHDGPGKYGFVKTASEGATALLAPFRSLPDLLEFVAAAVPKNFTTLDGVNTGGNMRLRLKTARREGDWLRIFWLLRPAHGAEWATQVEELEFVLDAEMMIRLVVPQVFNSAM